MQVIYNNGRIGIIKDTIFGLCAWDGRVWYPISNMDAEDLQLTKDLVDRDPLFPWKDELYAIVAKPVSVD